MNKITMYSADWCPYCARAELILNRKGLQVEKRNVDADLTAREEMIAKTGRRSVPQIFVGPVHVGGHDDLLAFERSGELDRLLNTVLA